MAGPAAQRTASRDTYREGRALAVSLATVTALAATSARFSPLTGAVSTTSDPDSLDIPVQRGGRRFEFSDTLAQPRVLVPAVATRPGGHRHRRAKPPARFADFQFGLSLGDLPVARSQLVTTEFGLPLPEVGTSWRTSISQCRAVFGRHRSLHGPDGGFGHPGASFRMNGPPLGDPYSGFDVRASASLGAYFHFTRRIWPRVTVSISARRTSRSASSAALSAASWLLRAAEPVDGRPSRAPGTNHRRYSAGSPGAGSAPLSLPLRKSGSARRNERTGSPDWWS